jgi:anti-sigma regulatory factor (Ser/Thr protein kinase)
MSTSAVCTIERRPDAAAAARRHAREVCRPRDELVAYDVELVVSELVTNALLHGAGRITLTLRALHHGIRVGVADRGPGEPRRVEATPGGCHGRGLLLVDAVAADWGVDRLSDGGKEVWCVVSASAPDSSVVPAGPVQAPA